MKTARIALRVLIRVGAVLAVLLAAGLYYVSFHLPGLVQSELLAALSDLGLPNATVRVAAIGVDRAILTDVDLDGTGRIRAESIEVGYRLSDVRRGRVRLITITGPRFLLRAADGRLDLGPLDLLESSGEGDGAAELPFHQIDVRAGRLIVDVDGDIRHFPVDGFFRNAGKGRIDVELTSRFEEKPVAIEGRVETTDLAADLTVLSNGVRLTIDYERFRDTLDWSLAGRRDRLSLYLEGRHLVGEGLDVLLSGRVKEGQLTRTSIAASANRVEFDGRAARDVRVELNGSQEFLTGTVSGRCDPRAAGLDLGPDAMVILSGSVGIHPGGDPVRAELPGLEVTVRGVQQAGFRGNLDAKLTGEVSAAGVKLGIASALVSGEMEAVPGPFTARLGKPGRIEATFAEPLDWNVSLPAVLLTARPEIPGFDGVEIRAMAVVKAAPGKTMVELDHASTVSAKSVRIRELQAEGVTARIGAKITMTPEETWAVTVGDAEVVADAARYGEFATGGLGAKLDVVAEIPEGKFSVTAQFGEPIEFTGPALSALVSRLALAGDGSYGPGGGVAFQGEVTAGVARGVSDATGVEIADASLRLPFAFGAPTRPEPGTLSVAGLKFLGRKFAGPTLYLQQQGEGIEFEGVWAPTAAVPIRLRGNAHLTQGGLLSRTEFESAPFDLSPKDVFGKLVLEKSGASVTGQVRAAGIIGIDRGVLTPEITIGLSGAEVTYQEDTLSLSGVSARVTIDSFPPTTPGGQRVSWEKARVGEIEFGAGHLEFQIESTSSLAVETVTCKFLPSGDFRIHPFRMNPANPDFDLEVFLERISLTRWLDMVAADKATGGGFLTGRLGMHIGTKPRLNVRFAPGALTAEPGGWFKVRDSSAIEKLLDENIPSIAGEVDYTRVVKDRVVQALRDFEYSTLRFEIIQNEGNQTLRAKIVGKGRVKPEGSKNAQELDLTVNINGFDTLIGTALALKLGLAELLGGD